MKQKTTKIIYWIITILFAGFMAMGAIPSEQGKAIMAHLGYAPYAMTILGTAKVIGAISILQNKYRTLKEWAYAGFTIDIIGAAASFFFAGDGIAATLMTVAFLIPMFASYFLWKKAYARKA